MKKQPLIFVIISLWFALGAHAQVANVSGRIVALKNTKQQRYFNLYNGLYERGNAQGEKVIKNIKYVFSQLRGIRPKETFAKTLYRTTHVCDEPGKEKAIIRQAGLDPQADAACQAAIYGQKRSNPPMHRPRTT